MNTTSTQNKAGEWVPAIEEPYYHLFRKECRCGKKFWTSKRYREHYALAHILKQDQGSPPPFDGVKRKI